MSENEEIIEPPTDFKLFLRGIGNAIRFKIVMWLMKKPKATLDEIRKFIRSQEEYCAWTDWSIPYHIKQLELGGVIQNYMDKDGFWYEITPFGKQLCSKLIDGYNAYHNQRLL